MSEPTTFRNTLIEQLQLIASDKALQEFQSSHPDIDAYSEARSAIVDYYSKGLLEYPPFRSEFTADELVQIDEHIEWMRSSVPGVRNKDRMCAEDLLRRLGHR
jgi:hypothetical protein